MLPVPEVDDDIVPLGLGIHRVTLFVNLFIYNSARDPHIEAWTIEEHGRGASWTKVFSVDCSAFINWNTPRKNPSPMEKLFSG